MYDTFVFVLKEIKILKGVVRRIFRQNDQQFQNRDNVYMVIFFWPLIILLFLFSFMRGWRPWKLYCSIICFFVIAMNYWVSLFCFRIELHFNVQKSIFVLKEIEYKVVQTISWVFSLLHRGKRFAWFYMKIRLRWIVTPISYKCLSVMFAWNLNNFHANISWIIFMWLWVLFKILLNIAIFT